MRLHPGLCAIFLKVVGAAWVSLDEGDIDLDEAEESQASNETIQVEDATQRQAAEMQQLRRSARQFFDERVGPQLDSRSRIAALRMFEPEAYDFNYGSFLELKTAIEAPPGGSPSNDQISSIVKNPNDGVARGILTKAWDFMQKSRGIANIAMPIFGALDPENCILHLLAFWYTLMYRFDPDGQDEDDYPYFPIHCGTGFGWETGVIV